MTLSTRGLYETLITTALEAYVGGLASTLEPQTHPLRPTEAADRIALHLSRIIRQVVADLADADRVEPGIIAIARALIGHSSRTPPASPASARNCSARSTPPTASTS